MNRKYEGLVVINTKGHEKSVEELSTLVGKEMEAAGAKLSEVQQHGRKEFAHEVKNLDGGHYVSFFFEAEPESIKDIQSRLKFNNDVYVQHYNRLD